MALTDKYSATCSLLCIVAFACLTISKCRIGHEAAGGPMGNKIIAGMLFCQRVRICSHACVPAACARLLVPRPFRASVWACHAWMQHVYTNWYAWLMAAQASTLLCGPPSSSLAPSMLHATTASTPSARGSLSSLDALPRPLECHRAVVG